MRSSIIISSFGDVSIFLLIKVFFVCFVMFCCCFWKKKSSPGAPNCAFDPIPLSLAHMQYSTCYNNVSVSSLWIFSIVAVHLFFLFDLKDLAALVVRLLLWENTVIVTVYLLYWLCNNIQLVVLNQNQLVHPLRSQKKTGIKLFFFNVKPNFTNFRTVLFMYALSDPK